MRFSLTLFIVLRCVWNCMPTEKSEEYYAPYSRYRLPDHLLNDVRVSRTDARRGHACALPSREDEPFDAPDFYFFAFVRDDEPSLLAHFLRWYKACGIDYQRRSHFVIHKVEEASLALAEFDKANVPRHRLEFVDTYSSRLKAEKVNTFLDTLPEDAWLVYPDADEFFIFPCDWGGQLIPLLDHIQKAPRLDAAYGAAALASKKDYTWLKRIGAPPAFLNDTPWSIGVDFVGGEMIDRVANDWHLPEIIKPPQDISKQWTNADIDNHSIFRQFPIPVRATSCLFHSRPFKQLLTRAYCHAIGTPAKQRFESSHRTSCFVDPLHTSAARRKTPPPLPPGFDTSSLIHANLTLLRRKKPPAIYPKSYSFPHFRFSAHAAILATEKRDAYQRTALKLTAYAERPDATIADKIAKANADHARLAYNQALLYFTGHGAQLRFRPEVRLVLELDCSGDRPAPNPDTPYTHQTSGRLDDFKRRKLLRVLALDSGNHQRRAFASFFQSFYGNDLSNVSHAHPDQLERLSLLIARGTIAKGEHATTMTSPRSSPRHSESGITSKHRTRRYQQRLYQQQQQKRQTRASSRNHAF